MTYDFHKKAYLTLLIVIAVILPFSLSFPATILVYRISIALLVLNWIMSKDILKVKSLDIRKSFPTVIIFSFYAMHIVALIYTGNISNGIFQLDKKIALTVFPVILVTIPALDNAEIKKVLKALLFSVLLSSCICIAYAIHRNNYLETFRHINWFYFSYNDLTEIVRIQPNYLALYVGLSILIMFYFLFERKSRGLAAKTGIVCAILYLFIFLFLLSGRTSIIAILLILSIGAIFLFYKRKMLFKGLVASGIILIFSLFIIFQIPIIKERFLHAFGIAQNTVWINQYGDASGPVPEVRLLKWKCAWNAIRENWFLGVGPGDVQDVLQDQYKKNEFDLAYNARFDTHNQYLQTWLGTGIPGLILFGASIAFPALIAFRKKNYLCVSFFCLLAICCFTESILERQLGIAFYSFFSAILMVGPKNEEEK